MSNCNCDYCSKRMDIHAKKSFISLIRSKKYRYLTGGYSYATFCNADCYRDYMIDIIEDMHDDNIKYLTLHYIGHGTEFKVK